MKEYTTLELVERWEHRREIINLMGKYCYYYLLKREDAIFEDLWSSEKDDICLGTNDGWYFGRDALKNYYANQAAVTKKASELYQKAFPQKLEKLTDKELYGVGQLEYKPFNSQVIEIAGNSKTAKGMWYCNGSYTKLTTGGPVSFWEWSVYAVDFVWEDNHWKLWHMQYLKDIDVPTGTSWGKEYKLSELFPPIDDFSAIESIKVEPPNIPIILRELYSVNRPFSPWPEAPVAFDRFEDTFSYGYMGGDISA